MSLEDLFADLRELPPSDLAEVIDLVERLRDRQAEASGEATAMLDAIARDPERRERFQASLDRAFDQMQRGEGTPVDEVMAEFRARSQERRAGG